MLPKGRTQNRFQYADEVNYQIGKHNIFFGGEFVRTQLNGNWTIQNNGYYTFNATMTAQYVSGTRKAIGSGFADVLARLSPPQPPEPLERLSATSVNGRSTDTCRTIGSSLRSLP